jgi:D-serine deaminase-like pyridoxal phosphate-dependent protein
MKTKGNYHFAGEEEIISPQLVYYPEIIRENIDLMIKIAGDKERLWPHIKTHKMEKVTKLLLSSGITRFKCATVAECETAAKAGAKELLLAYPLVGPNIGRFAALSKSFPDVKIYAIGDDTEQVKKLGACAAADGLRVLLLMDIDMGQHRTGVVPEKARTLYPVWSRLPGIVLSGFHCYDGHRHESDLEARNASSHSSDLEIEALKIDMLRDGFSCNVIVMGGTPSFPCHRNFTNEFLSPGTCVIQDAGYRDAYPDLPFTPGAAILTRVVSRPTEDTFTLDLGTKAVACDPPLPRAEVIGFEAAETVMQNEEHLVLRVPAAHIPDIPEIGSVLFALPVHICPTTALYPSVPAVENGRVIEWWDVTARDRRITI